MSVQIVALVGSLRVGSQNRRLAQAAVKLAPEGVQVRVLEGLDEVPFYNEDLDVAGSVPAAATTLRESVARADAVMLFTPEYNGTIPAVLKNAIDWLSRPYGEGALTGKPLAVLGASAGQYGGTWAHQDARKAAGAARAVVIEDIIVSIPHSLTRFADTDPIDDAEVADQLGSALARLVQATEQIGAVGAAQST